MGKSTVNPARAPTPETPASTTRVRLPAEEFALADLFERVPDARVECESAVANPDDHALVVVRTDEREHAVEAALRADPSVGTVERFGEHADGWRYRVTWIGRPRRLIQQLVAGSVTLLSVRGQGGQWKFRLLSPDHEGIARAYDIMEELGCEAECLSILSGGAGGTAHTGLTDEQHEALLTAFEIGYYNIPRDASMEEVAEGVGIFYQALSERVRRAHKHLIGTERISTDDESL